MTNTYRLFRILSIVFTDLSFFLFDAPPSHHLPPMKPVKIKPPRKKHEPVDDRLLATAGRCFIEDGFGFGIDDILAQSNVAKMSLYLKFQSKYGLIERLLEDAAAEWRTEIDRVTADASLHGTAKVVELIQSVCGLSRDRERRTGLIGQAIIEFPRTGKADETHKKKDLVHERALRLQRELLKPLESFCGDAGAKEPERLAQQILLLTNGYLVCEPLLGKAAALKLLAETAQGLVHAALSSTTPAPVTSRARKNDPTSIPKRTPPRSTEKIRPVAHRVDRPLVTRCCSE